MSAPRHIRTPLARVRGFGAARSGTGAFWHQRVSAVANVPLTIAAMVIMIMLLFVGSITIHMRIGMQVIIEDYVQDDLAKIVLVVANSFFAIIVGLASVYGLLKLSFGL